MITKEILQKIAPLGKEYILTDVSKYLDMYLDKYEVNTWLRLCHFIAQCAHESDGFKTLEEYASGAAYEGRADLGNTQKGDGIRYKGRGMIQLTGRANYRQIGNKIGVDLENHPELASTGQISVQTALEFWKVKGLNTYADHDDINTITRRINGGDRGLPSRIAYFGLCKKYIPQENAKFNPILAKRGDKSDYVKSIQQLFIKRGYPLAPYGADGDFGATTETAVKNFQTAQKLPITGQVDQNTLDKLKE